MSEPSQADPRGGTDPIASSRPQAAPLEAALGRFRSSLRAILVARAVLLWIAAVMAGVLAAAVTDYLLRLPPAVRMVVWCGGLGAGAWAAWRWAVPAARFRPPLHELALRVERTEAASRAGLRGELASALELATDNRAVGDSNRWMRDRVVAGAVERFRGFSLRALIDARPGLRGLGVALAAGLALAIPMVVAPMHAAIGARRVLTPWADVQWPRRTAVADVTGLHVHPFDVSLPLRAAVTRTDQPEGRTTVAARYRLIVDGRAGPVRRVLLTGQKRRVEVFADEDTPGGSGELFERLVELDPAGPELAGLESQGSGTPGPGRVEFEYWFETPDDRTDAARILLAASPKVMGATAVVTPPAYAGAMLAGSASLVSGPMDLGPGDDGRAVVGPVLAGSRVDVTIRLNKSIPGPERNGPAANQWVERTLGRTLPAGLSVAWPDGATIALSWSAAGPARLTVSLLDEYGLVSQDESVYSFETVEDRPPTPVVVDPSDDQWVLPTATVSLAGEARDDAGLEELSLGYQRASPPPGSIGAAPEAVGDEVEAARRVIDPASGPVLHAGIAAVLELTPMRLTPGDELRVWVLASDNFEIDGRRHAAARSAVRKLRIISEEQLVEQVQAELAGVRQAVMSMDQEQAAIRRATDAAAGLRGRQAGLTERAAAQRDAVARLSDRVGLNNLDDQALQGLLRDAESLLADAAAASARATEAMPDADGADEGASADAGIEQDLVRDALGQIAELLDQGQDSWLVRRDLERLIRDQRDLADRTRAQTDPLTGRAAESLPDDQRRALEDLADRQRSLADRAGQLLDDLAGRAELLRDADGSQAAAMDRAAERGRRDQVPQSMEQAAESIGDNRGEQAADEQEASAEALEGMLEDIQSADRSRDEALRRVLRSLIESIRALADRQAGELEALVAALDPVAAQEPGAAEGALAGLDGRLISLHQNTLAVADAARVGFREVASIAGLIDGAARAQSTAVRALRSDPADTGLAEREEGVALARLRQALDEAERLEQEATDRENDRVRRELRRAYRDLLEQQVVLRDESTVLVGAEDTRRHRVLVRRLGERQAQIRDRAAEIPDIAGGQLANVLEYAHRRLDATTGSAADRLSAGVADAGVIADQDTAVRLLTSLAEAVSEGQNGDDSGFRDSPGDGQEGGGDGNGGGEGGQQALVPPIAELRLLREMQADLAERTRRASESGDAAVSGQLTALQRELADQGMELIRRMQAGPGGQP